MKKYILLILSLLIFSSPIFCQVNPEIDKTSQIIPYDEINVAFALEAEPTLEEVGFDNPKSSWKFSYELRFLNDAKIAYEAQKRVYAKYENQGVDRMKWLPQANKKLDKEVKKLGVLVTKGKINKSALLSTDNREIIIPIKLTPEIQQIITKSAASDANPEFRIYVKGKLSTKTSSKLKFSKKYTGGFGCSVKMWSSDKKQYWSLNRCGVSIETVNKDNKIQFGMFSRL